jgi:hypothetical protein
MLQTHRIHELDLRDIEIVDDEPATIEVSWDELLDVEDSRPPVRAFAPGRRNWNEAMENADTRIYIRPYAARL